MANPFFNAKTDAVLKEKLKQFFKKYNYTIETDKKDFNHMYAMVSKYNPEGKIDQDSMIAGYLHSRLIYVPKEDK